MEYATKLSKFYPEIREDFIDNLWQPIALETLQDAYGVEYNEKYMLYMQPNDVVCASLFQQFDELLFGLIDFKDTIITHVGSWIGRLDSKLFLKGAYKIYAVEPNPISFSLLYHNSLQPTFKLPNQHLYGIRAAFDISGDLFLTPYSCLDSTFEAGFKDAAVEHVPYGRPSELPFLKDTDIMLITHKRAVMSFSPEELYAFPMVKFVVFQGYAPANDYIRQIIDEHLQEWRDIFVTIYDDFASQKENPKGFFYTTIFFRFIKYS